MQLMEEPEIWLHAARITDRALDGLNDLPHLERQDAIDVLASPFRHSRSDKMHQRRDIDLWRVRVNRDVRVTYRIEDGVPVILHIGRHAASDAFVARYRATDETSQPLERIEIMATATKPHKKVLAMPTPQRPVSEEFHRLFTALVGEVVRDESKGENDLVLTEIDRIDGVLRELKDQVAQMGLDQEEETGEIAEKVNGLLAEAKASLTRHPTTTDDMVRLLGEIHEFRERLSACQGRTDDLGRRISYARSDLQAQINEISDCVAAMAKDIAWLRQQEERRQRSWWGWLMRRWAG